MNEAEAIRDGAHRKDVELDRLASRGNVAQFVSFRPAAGMPEQTFCRLRDLAPNTAFASPAEAIEALRRRSAEGRVNLRTFTPESPRGREFIYGLADGAVAASEVGRLVGEGLWVIANETIDVADGGVSGVSMNGVVEFTPDDTPRGVEKPGFAALPRAWADHVLSSVYGFRPDLGLPVGERLEFSVHPMRRGWLQGHILFWERETVAPAAVEVRPTWPNRFSRMLGDKVYGLLVADAAGLRVPRTTVVSRRVAPFTFGVPTGGGEVWLRTSPHEQVPGRFTTVRGWTDPFALLAREDPAGSELASVLSQEGVPSRHAGAAIETGDGALVVEGVSGEGDRFMLGERAPERLPADVTALVGETHRRASAALGPVRFEWVHDGDAVWIVQLHRGRTASGQGWLVRGDAERWVRFDVTGGLEALRQVLASLSPGAGIVLEGPVGLTSHVADLVRRAGVPTRIASID